MVIKLVGTRKFLDKHSFLKDCVIDAGFIICPIDDEKFDELLNRVEKGEIKDHYIKAIIKKMAIIRGGDDIGDKARKDIIARLQKHAGVTFLPSAFHVRLPNNGRMYYSIIKNEEDIIKIVMGENRKDVLGAIKEMALVLDAWTDAKYYDRDLKLGKQH